MRQLAAVALLGAVLAGGCFHQDEAQLENFANASCIKMPILTPTEAVNMLAAAAPEAEAAGFTKDQFHAALVHRCPNLMDSLDQLSAAP